MTTKANTPGSPKGVGSRKASGKPNTLTPELQRAIDGEYAGTDPYYRGRRDAIRELYESGGLPHSQLGLEILFLLPDTFVRGYQQLFHEAMLGGSGQAVSGKGGGIEKAQGKKNGIVLGSEVGLQSSGTGKRWKNTSAGQGVGRLRAFEAKTTLDGELQELIRTTLQSIRSKADSPTQPVQCQGTKPGRNGATLKCRRFLKGTWKFCPECGTRRT